MGGSTIVQVAITAVLVGKTECGEYIGNVKKALVTASQETESNKLIEGKGDLIKSLQGRLAKVISKENQTPPVEKQSEKKW